MGKDQIREGETVTIRGVDDVDGCLDTPSTELVLLDHGFATGCRVKDHRRAGETDGLGVFEGLVVSEGEGWEGLKGDFVD